MPTPVAVNAGGKLAVDTYDMLAALMCYLYDVGGWIQAQSV